MGGKQSCGQTVGVGFRILGATDPPLLTAELVIGIVGLPGGQDYAGRIADRTGHEPSQGIVAVLVGYTRIIFVLLITYRVELPVAGVGVG